MEKLMSIRKQAGVMLATLLLAGAALAQAPDIKPVRIRGDIVSLRGDILTVHRRSGDTVSIEVKTGCRSVSSQGDHSLRRKSGVLCRGRSNFGQ
jgi:hypothetical protein